MKYDRREVRRLTEEMVREAKEAKRAMREAEHEYCQCAMPVELYGGPLDGTWLNVHADPPHELRAPRPAGRQALYLLRSVPTLRYEYVGEA